MYSAADSRKAAVNASIHPDFRPALTELLAAIPGGINALETIEERRDAVNALLMNPINEKVTREDRSIPGPTGAPDVKIRIYRPKNMSTGTRDSLKGALINIHGGGMVMGGIATDDGNAAFLCEKSGVLTIGIEYRLAPEHPFPAALEDCYAVTKWVFENATNLNLDPDRIVLYGGSAGGGLALALTMLMRDQGVKPFSFQMAIYPMIDDRHVTQSSNEITDIGIWDRQASIESWAWYLGKAFESGEISPYAAPSRASDLTNLPPTFIDVGTHDLFLDEDIEFARRLEAAGVPVEFHLNEGAYHAAELFGDSPAGRVIWARRIKALRKALGDNH